MAYIEREKVIELINNFGKGAIEDGRYTLDSVDDIILLARAVDLIPTVDAAPGVHGKWRKRKNEKTCSVCSFIYYSNNDEWNFCPNCGAKMDGKVSE